MAAAPTAALSTAKLYKGVMEEVVANVRESFLDEGVDDAILQELKQIWEAKVLATKAIDTLNPAPLPSQHSTSSRHSHSSSSHSASHSSLQHQQHTSIEHQQQQSHYAPSTVRPVPLIQQVMATQSGVITQQLTNNIGTAAVPHSVITNAQSSGYLMALPGVQTAVRLVGGPQIPTVPASTMASLMGSGVLMHKAEKQMPGTSNVTIVSGSTPQLDGAACLGKANKQKIIIQLDGPGMISDDEDDIDENEPVHEDEDEPVEVLSPVNDGEPLNSEDDVSVDNEDETFEADDVVVCQFEKVNRIRNKWKFILKDGIMNLGRKDYVFNRATGEAEF